MPRITIRDVGKYGIIDDLPPHELPPEAWSAGDGIRFMDTFVEASFGEIEEVYGTFTAQPYKVAHEPTSDGSSYWAYCGLEDIYVIVPAGPPASHTNITRAAGVYTGTVEDRWNVSWLNGIMIFNNGVDKPQLWSSINSGIDLVDLTNWPATWRAKVVRPFRNFLIAMDITKSTTRYPTLVSWSHPADPGSAPSSWDIADTTKLTGDFPLSQTSGAIVDCLGMRDANVIYKEDAVILQQFVGGQDIFAWRDISLTAGLAAQDCVVEFRPGYHVFLAKDSDICVCNGQTVESVIDAKRRDALKGIGWNYLHESFVVAHPVEPEVWFFIGSYANFSKRIFIWNWRTGAWAEGATGANYIDAARGQYQAIASDTRIQTVLGVKNAQTKGYRLAQQGEVNSWLWRDGLALIGQNRDGSPRVDYNKHKVVTEIWPMLEAPSGTAFYVTIDATDDNTSLANSASPNAQTFTFTAGTDTKIDCLVEGRFISIGFETAEAVSNWKLHGYSLELNVVGEYA